MKATLEFDLSDPDDAARHAQCLAGHDALLALRKLWTDETTAPETEAVLEQYDIDLEALLP